MMTWSFDPQIKGATLVIDGTADAEVLKRFWPGINIVPVNVRAEHYHAIQITDRSVPANTSRTPMWPPS
jgi:hypothetical protein